MVVSRCDALWRDFSCENALMRFTGMRSRILHGAAFAAALLLSAGLLLQKAAAATTLTLTWQASLSSPNIDGYRVYYGTSSGNYSQHADFLGTGTRATVVAPPAGSTYYYTAVAYKGSLESSDSNQVTKSTPAASPTPTPTPTPTSTPDATATPTATPTPTPRKVRGKGHHRRPSPTPTP